MYRAVFTLFFLLFGSASVLYAESADMYVVQAGDTLAAIARRFLGKPVFSQNGSLARLLEMNPDQKNPNLIFPGDKISLKAERTMASDASAAQEAPAATPTPVTIIPTPPAPVAPSEPAFDPVSQLGVDFGFSYFRIDSVDRKTGSSSTLLSSLSPEVRITWDLSWSPNWNSHIAFATHSEKVLDDVSSNPKKIQDASGSRNEIEGGVGRRWNDSTRTDLTLAAREQIFGHSPDLTTFAIDRVAVPSVGLTQEFDLFRVKKATGGLAVSAESLFAGSGPGYSIDSGYGGEISAYLRHELKNFDLQGRIFYGESHQNSSLLEQKENHIGAEMGFIWRFGE